jgi:hypothetical protein
MPWPETMNSLLARPDTRAAQALRWGLHGLRASLHAALDEVSPEPGGEDLRALLAELEPLLGKGQTAASTLLPTDGPSDLPAQDGSDQLLLPPLAKAVAEDSRLGQLRGSVVGTRSDDEIWNDVQRLLLRLPRSLSEEWRRRSLKLAGQLGARPQETQEALLPLPEDKELYPSLTGKTRATGLRSSPAAPLDPRIGHPGEGDLRVLAGITSAYLWFIENDPHLYHCLKSVFRFGLAPLAGEQRDRYVNELLRCWERVRGGGLGPKERLKARLDLDEAFHSLVYQPTAATDSWWGRLLSEARDTLFAAREEAAGSGCSVHLQVLGGNFADVNWLAPDSLQVDFGVPGEVCACLRVWARIDGEELKGRVLYRSPPEGA